MPSTYPGAADLFTNITTPTAVTTGTTVGGRTQSQFINDIGDAVEAIEGTLGLNPQGAFATVGARLGSVPAMVVGGAQPAAAGSLFFDSSKVTAPLAPLQIAASASVTMTNQPYVQITCPLGITPGDLMIMTVNSGSVATGQIVDPVGWKLVPVANSDAFGSYPSSTGHQIRVYTRYAQTSDVGGSTVYTVTLGTTTQNGAVSLVGIRNGALESWSVTADYTTASPTINLPATTVPEGYALLAFVAHRGTTPNVPAAITLATDDKFWYPVTTVVGASGGSGVASQGVFMFRNGTTAQLTTSAVAVTTASLVSGRQMVGVLKLRGVPVAPGTRLLVGVKPLNLTAGGNLGYVQTEEAFYGTVPFGVERVFYATEALFAASAATVDYAMGRNVVVSFKAKAQALIAGTYDADINAWLDSVPANDGFQYWLCWLHEPGDEIRNGYIFGAGDSTDTLTLNGGSDGYITGTNKVASLVKNRRPDVGTCQIMLDFYLSKTYVDLIHSGLRPNQCSVAEMTAGVTNMDALFWDMYFAASDTELYNMLDGTTVPFNNPNTGAAKIDDMCKRARLLGRETGATEFGIDQTWDTGGVDNRTGYLADHINRLRNNGALLWCYYNQDTQGGTYRQLSTVQKTNLAPTVNAAYPPKYRRTTLGTPDPLGLAQLLMAAPAWISGVISWNGVAGAYGARTQPYDNPVVWFGPADPTTTNADEYRSGLDVWVRTDAASVSLTDFGRVYYGTNIGAYKTGINDATLTAALSFCKSQARAPMLMFPNGELEFGASVTFFPGMSWAGSVQGTAEYGNHTLLRWRSNPVFVYPRDGGSVAQGVREVRLTGITFSGPPTFVHAIDFIEPLDLDTGPILSDFYLTRCGVVWFQNGLWARLSRYTIEQVYWNHNRASLARGIVTIQGNGGHGRNVFIDTDANETLAATTNVGEGIFGMFFYKEVKSTWDDLNVTTGPHSGIMLYQCGPSVTIDKWRVDGYRPGDSTAAYTYDTSTDYGRTKGVGLRVDTSTEVEVLNGYCAKVAAAPIQDTALTVTSYTGAVLNVSAPTPLRDWIGHVVGVTVGGGSVPANTRVLAVTASTVTLSASLTGTVTGISVLTWGDAATVWVNPRGGFEQNTSYDFIQCPAVNGTASPTPVSPGTAGTIRATHRLEGAFSGTDTRYPTGYFNRIGYSMSCRSNATGTTAPYLRAKDSATGIGFATWGPFSVQVLSTAAATDALFPLYKRTSDSATLPVPDGAQGLDTTNSKLWYKSGGTWKGVVIA